MMDDDDVNGEKGSMGRTKKGRLNKKEETEEQRHRGRYIKATRAIQRNTRGISMCN
jgi:hypothetical protein